jgi:hypothetical protein
VSLLKKLARAVGKAAGGVVSQATGGLVRPNFTRGARAQGMGVQRVDSIVNQSSSSLFGGNRSRTTAYYSQGTNGGGRGQDVGSACGIGYRGNKSTYVTRGGGTSRWPQSLMVHEKGTECVKRRRRNVGNAKALRRAISRVKGFVKLSRKATSLVGPHHRRSSGGCSTCGKKKCSC